MDANNIWKEVENNGYAVIDDVFSTREADLVLAALRQHPAQGKNFRVSNGLFAIRQLLTEIPALAGLLFNTKLTTLLNSLPAPAWFVVKSIYFDKPEQSNWVVAWHRDLSINVRSKSGTLAGFKGWLKKDGQYSVQPPLALLQGNITIRIHLDDTTEDNGALKVIPGSHHLSNIVEDAHQTGPQCAVQVKKGGVMLMKPLLLHASGRTTNGQPRRVIHVEFSNSTLPAGIAWSEYMEIAESGDVQSGSIS